MDRITNAITNYQRYVERTNCGNFYADDGFAIARRSKGSQYNMIFDALMAGFWIGYQRARREAREKQHKQAAAQ